ncbi:M16 family metallopeptidase [Altererythrobacter aquiaggeris]|uniref:M16 family metallopeptidase n=1 Tax=Aestuarierythrobacter aquiaggeris TaxID=1898396 RepID=UPI00301B1F91
MKVFSRKMRHFVLVLPLLVLAPSGHARTAQENTPLADPAAVQTSEETPWLYRGSDIPPDREWHFGEMENGLRYAVRKNGVPPDQISIRIRIDAGSLHETDDERGFAHLIEHLLFRESKYLGEGEAIRVWERLGASFGSDTNAETSPTQTVYKLDLPNATPASIEESLKLLSGMIREPALTAANVKSEVPIVLAEKRERGGPGQRIADETRATLFAGQRLASRSPIGTVETLEGATQKGVRAFHKRWYRPENVVIAIAGDADEKMLAALVERYFADWQGEGPLVAAPDFGDPVAPDGADSANPVGETAVLVEPDLPRSITVAVMRPWRPVQDTIVYNEGLLLTSVAQAIINRRLESRARAGGSYLFAQVRQDDVSRTSDATFLSVAPLTADWRGALNDARGVIADAIANPPTQEEIDREVAEFDVVFASLVAERAVKPGSELADDIVNAVDIRETTAAPETVLEVFRGMKGRLNPAEIQQHTRDLFVGDVIRSVYVTPATGEADAARLRTALLEPIEADGSSRLAASSINFSELPEIGAPGTVIAEGGIGLVGIEAVQLSNGVRAILWSNGAEPGRVAVKVRFGSGYRAFSSEDAAYASLGQFALVGSGIGPLGEEDLDRIATGRKLAFEFDIDEGVFTLDAETRDEDLADQLYLFAAKLGMPRWDANPVLRAKAAGELAYESYSTSPGALMQRDLEFLLRNDDQRFATPTPEMLAKVTPERFREVWEPLLKQGPVEVLIMGEFDKPAALEALKRTFGALPPREMIPAAAEARSLEFPAPTGETKILRHRGDANQAAAVVAWPSGGGVPGTRISRQLEILTRLFSNRLMDEMRERAGASYAPQVVSDWPVDVPAGGKIMALAQLKPEDVPAFFAAADAIAADLAANPPSEDELVRVTEPLKQLITRASTGNRFWLYQLEGASFDPRRVEVMRSMLLDYTETTPEAMQVLAKRFLASREGFRLAVIPEGQELAISSARVPAAASAPVTGR